MHFNPPWADEWALVPDALRQILLRAGARQQHSDPDHCVVRLEICDSDLTFLFAVELSGPESLQRIAEQAAELGYRTLRLVAATRDESCRFVLVRNRDTGARHGDP